MNVKCRCGKSITYHRKDENKVIYRCVDTQCYCLRDISEEEYTQMIKEQEFIRKDLP